MCLNPLLIPNPHLNHHLSPIYRHDSFLHDTKSQFIYVPCGHCKECIALKQMYLVQRVQMESLNSFMFFTTLTYSDEHLPRYICDNGFKIPFADTLHLQLLFDRLRKDNSFGRPARYLAVSERGGLKGRPHFHILWFLPRFDGEDYVDGLSLESLLFDKIKHYWAINRGSKKFPHYVPLFDYHEKWRSGKLYRNYDTHFVRPSLTCDGVSSLAFYVCKYMLKASSKERKLQQALRLNLEPASYNEAYSVVKSKSVRSSSFGFGFSQNRSLVIEHLKKGISLSKSVSPFPLFFSPESNLSFPLCPYYKSFPDVFSMRDYLDFKMNDDSIYVDYNKSITDVKVASESFERIANLVDSKDLGLEFDWLSV